MKKGFFLSALCVCLPAFALAQASIESERVADSLTSPAAFNEDKLVAEATEFFDLVYGHELGDVSRQKARSLAKRLRNDGNLLEEFRFEVAAFFYHDALESDEKRRDQVASWGEVELLLVEEYPFQQYGYEGLMSAAEHASDRELSDLFAQELLVRPETPTWIRDRAQTLVSRNDLVGLSLSPLLQGAWEEGAEQLGGAGKTIIFSWTSEELLAHKQYMKGLLKKRKDCVILGVCLDQDVDAATKKAKMLGLAGLCHFSAKGADSLLAQRLFMNQGLLVYETDEAGIIRSVGSARPSAGEKKKQWQPKRG